MKRILAPAVTLLAAATLTACSATAEFDDADVMFAQMMIPHHEQAVEMSDAVLATDGIDPQVAELATEIKAAQAPEIEQLERWLEDWGADSMPAHTGHAGHAGHAGMDGMMSESDLQALDDAEGAEATRLFLEQMIVHHEGAITMAQVEVEQGRHEGAVAMARTIIKTQSAEIDAMEELLGRAPRMEHVHGIGVDPADGTVYAGTHHGLFRMDDDGPHLVGGHVQDFMGFTVAGPGRFLASGHPGEGQGGHASVGLLESTDTGESWTERSLGGEADFHALEYRHDRVYGLNSMTGQLLASDDLRTWEELTRTPMADFAVDPQSPDVMVATTEDGPAVSGDGGRTFETVPTAPLLVLVSWGDDGTLVGVTPEGVIHTADRPTGEWTERGRLPGRPEALTVVSSSRIYAAADGKVLVSEDQGATFSEL